MNYECDICHLHYETKDLAKSCEKFCKEKSGLCNSEIVEQSIEAKK